MACSTSQPDQTIEILSNSEANLPQTLNNTSHDISFCIPSVETGDYKLVVEDVIKVSVLDEQNLSGEFKIDNNGMITMPLIGDVGIAGCTTTEARQIIKDRYADGYLINPNIAVEIESYNPIYIIGEVREPGEFSYAPNMTVLKAVALAGGYTYRANKKTIQILRKKPNGSAVQGNYDANAKIMPGDIITIKERLF